MARGMNLQQTAAGLELDATLMRLIESHQRLLLAGAGNTQKPAEEKEQEEIRDKVMGWQLDMKKIRASLYTKAKREKRSCSNRFFRRQYFIALFFSSLFPFFPFTWFLSPYFLDLLVIFCFFIMVLREYS
jgi:hypothetical protein